MLISDCENCEKIDSQSKDCDEPDEPIHKKRRIVDHIPLNCKIKTLNKAEAHPSWNLKSLQKNGCSLLKKMKYLAKWREDVIKCGNTFG